MSTDKTRLEIGHVLFIDIVGYSKLLLKPQSELLRELNEIVSGTNEFREADSAGKLIRLPTGDGMALVFRTNTEAPVECAMRSEEHTSELQSPMYVLTLSLHDALPIYVLFIDIVGYSKLLLKPQSELLRELNEIVSGTNEFREADSAGKLIRLPTGDGMALVFRTNTEAPVECAM